MKKILTIIVAICTLTGCKKDLLETKPYSQIASETMWTTDNLTDQGITGVYALLRYGMASGGASGLELYQMDALGFTGQTSGAEAVMTGTVTPGNGYFSSHWQNLYEGIQRANDAIKNIPLKSPSVAAKKARYVAEAKFLRAYFYLRLNQLYKGVPIYTEPFTADQATKARNTEAEVWAQVISDLNDVISEVNLPDRYLAGNASYGHITKGAAYALRGKAYMYTQKWDLASADFQKVKDVGYSLFPNYSALFKTANEQSAEMIFSIQNIGVSGFGSTTQFYCGTRSSFGSCWNTYHVSPNLVDLYENADGSKFNWDTVLPGYSSLSVAEREVYFLRNNLTDAEIAAATKRGAKMSLYLPTGNEARILAAYANRDPRLAANVITPYSTYLGVFSGANAVVTSRWPYRSEAATNGDLRTDTQSLFYYLYRKYVYEGTSETPARDYGPTDFALIRYADVLLMWAEALNEQGAISDAIGKVNEVRTRAGALPLQNVNAALPTYVTGQADLRERIRNERRVEFPNEGINFFDEMRWKSWKDKVFYAGNGVKQVWGNVVYAYSFKGDYLYNWAIPSVEIERNPNLKQNPGWIN
ncbi:RagB/SusD family nutrient uptake outer membrane protein [Pedobacter sp. HMWF019]|uniref:RagB/SusD family nutrient uptake outer membrane protein n=1 Tax=Pedobacter sp. HMWF019 TaxID=2056856 RepID=UPI000D3BF970|nr:RagB/SusD family nutrient uptake outer membrane protein [Pedobacter sp. HMWF019]PTS98977.1 RagB/SusD family nutrient uptake outer membrane protein [Pedobacter sp. HMWF019]